MLEMVKSANSLLWGLLLIVLLCGTGIYYTIRLRFIQIRKFGEGFKLVFGNMSFKGEKGKNGEMTPFQSLATAIAAQVGTGNLTGAATALISGGPGAIFWMWLSAFFGMSTIYAEASLAQKYKVVEDGNVTGGPVYYIKQAFKGPFGKFLAGAFAVFITLALGFMGNMVQSNSIAAAFLEVFRARQMELNPLWIGVPLAVFACFIFIGGTSRLASFVEKVVPIMAGVYIVGSIILIVMHAAFIPEAIKLIFVGAFKPQSIAGGALGISVQQAIRYGVARGLFSNEAGMGSTPHAHARATAKNPHEQGLTAMISVFIDTFIILNLTAFSIITTNVMSSGKTGIVLTQSAFTSGFGSFGDIFIAVCLLFFAFSTILSWHFFGAINVKYLFGGKTVKVYSVLVVICIIIGAMLKVEFVWELADFFNGLMVIPNVLALFALGSVVSKICKDYGSNK